VTGWVEAPRQKSRWAAFLAAKLTSLDGLRISGILKPIINLPGRDINDQLAELDRVAGGV